MERNIKEWIVGVKQSRRRLAIPIMTHPGIDLTGKSVYDAVTNGRIHFEAISALNKKYPAAASTIMCRPGFRMKISHNFTGHWNSKIIRSRSN